jgi:hypothetical protein
MILTQTKIIYELVVLQGGFFVEGGGWRVDFRSVIKRGFS